MPIHDWTRVPAGTWHAFHLSWISALQESLNDGLLPPDHYAQAEQIIGPFGPDVLTLKEAESGADAPTDQSGGGTVVLELPQTRICAEAEVNEYVLKRRTLVVRHASGDHVVAQLEIVSPGNKSTAFAFRSFVEKAAESLYRGYHLLVIDLFPPGPRDPCGIHAAIWGEFSNDPVALPPDEPLTLAAYSAGPVKRAFIEPTAVGHVLMDMPLFLTPEAHVNVPLEATYQTAYHAVPRRWRAVLESETRGD